MVRATEVMLGQRTPHFMCDENTKALSHNVSGFLSDDGIQGLGEKV